MRCLVLVNGDYGDYGFCQDIETYDYIICADNGMRHARHLGIMPDLIVGDFDSNQHEDLLFFKDKQVTIQRFSSVKDETDTEIAIEQAIQKGAKEIMLYGGLGTRFDHTLANVHLMYRALKQNIKVSLINPYNKVFLIKDQITLLGNPGDLVSLLPFTQEVSGIGTQNLAYVLDNAKLTWEKPYGVSNYMLDSQAVIHIDQGILIVIQAKD